jgi:L-fucose isomerase-like protein
MRRIALFWPGDYREMPNRWALPQVQAATEQLSAALKKLGKAPYLVKGFLTKPHEAIEKLGPIDDPLIGLFVHWAYGPHTCEGVVGKQNPLLLASNFSGTWPGLVALLNTSACLEILQRTHSRVWTSGKDWSKDKIFMARLEEWCSTGRIAYDESELHSIAPVSDAACQLAGEVGQDMRRKRPLALMLGDTSMGMINGYFGARVLARLGFSEHKVDQAWLSVRMQSVQPARIEEAFQFVCAKGVRFHWREKDADDFTEEVTKKQLQMYLAVLDLAAEFQADCVGWQYQLGLLYSLPPSDFCEGLLNSACRPESDGHPLITSTEADQGNLLPMEMMKRLLQKKGLADAVLFHDVRWGAEHGGRWLWVLLNSGSCGAYAFNHDEDSLEGVHSYRQPAGYFPIPGGTFAGMSKPGKLTWARAYLRGEEPWMDIGTGESVELPEKVREKWWRGTTRQWPFMAADLHCAKDTLMAHYLSNHIAVAYGDIFGEMIALSQQMGYRVRILRKTLAP